MHTALKISSVLFIDAAGLLDLIMLITFFLCTGTVNENHPVKEVLLNDMPENYLYGPNQSAGVESPKAFASAKIMEDGDVRLGDDKIVIRQTYKKEIILSKMPVYAGRPPKISFASNSDVTEIESSFENYEKHSASTIPKYVNLEPSLAMDWLEISWDELHIKERVGAGTPLVSFIYWGYI